MLLNGKTAIVFGAGGAIGGAVAKAFAREGASVFLSGRNASPVEAVANEIRAAGGVAETATVDALDETAIERHVAEVAEKLGGIDVMLNAIGFSAVALRQGVPLTDLAQKDFAYPIATWPTSQFLTARAVSSVRRCWRDLTPSEEDASPGGFIRSLSHIVCFDDAPFAQAHRGSVLVVGAVYTGPHLAGVITGRVRRDGADATRALIAMVRDSRFAALCNW